MEYLPKVIIAFMLVLTFVLPGAATKVSAASKGTKPASSDNYKPVVSVEEIPKVLEGLQELFKGCRWGSLEKGCNKTKDELVQAILDGYANMDMPYTMEERREALGLIPSDDPRVKGKVYIY